MDSYLVRIESLLTQGVRETILIKYQLLLALLLYSLSLGIFMIYETICATCSGLAPL